MSESPISLSFSKVESLAGTPIILSTLGSNNSNANGSQALQDMPTSLSHAEDTVPLSDSLASGSSFFSGLNGVPEALKGAPHSKSCVIGDQREVHTLNFFENELQDSQLTAVFNASAAQLRQPIVSEMAKLTLKSSVPSQTLFNQSETGTIASHLGATSGLASVNVNFAESDSQLLSASRLLQPTANNPFGIQPRKKRGRPRKAVSTGMMGSPQNRTGSLISKLYSATGLGPSGAGSAKREGAGKRLARSFTSGVDNKYTIYPTLCPVKVGSSDVDMRNRSASWVPGETSEHVEFAPLYDRAFSTPALTSVEHGTLIGNGGGKSQGLHLRTSYSASSERALAGNEFRESLFLRDPDVQESADIQQALFFNLSPIVGGERGNGKLLNDLERTEPVQGPVLIHSPSNMNRQLSNVPRAILPCREANIESSQVGSDPAYQHGHHEKQPQYQLNRQIEAKSEIQQKLQSLEQLAHTIRHDQNMYAPQNDNLEALEATIVELSALVNAHR